MSKVAVITDSIACLTREQVEEHAIRIVPANIAFEGKTYRDWVELSPSLAYQFLERAPEHFETAPASPGEYLEAFREVSREAESILCIAISSGLSVCYDNAQAAKEMAKQQLPQTTIEVLDSRTATAGQGLIVLEAARAARAGKSLEEVIKAAEVVKEKVKVLLVFETIRHVYRTGRVPKVASQIGSALNIKPILAIAGGALKFIGITRKKGQGVERMLKLMRESVGTGPVHVGVMHADVPEEGQRLKERVSTEFDCVELFLTEFSPLIGYATGRGTLGLAFYSGM